DVVALVAEKVAKQLEFTLAREIRLAEFDDRDIRFPGTAELLVGFQQRLKQVFAAAYARERVSLAEFLHRRRIVKQVGQGVAIARARGRIRVILNEVEVPVYQVGIEPRGHLQRLVAGIDRGQHFLRGQQLETRQQRRIGQDHLLHAVDRADQRLA